MGDPAGIGPDITITSWSNRSALGLPPFAVYGDPATLEGRSRRLGLAAAITVVTNLEETPAAFREALPVIAVRSATEAGAVVAAIDEATAAVAQGKALAIVTNPIAKKTLQTGAFQFPGHTEYLAELASRHSGGRKFQPVMMLASDELKVVPATIHIPLSAVPSTLTAVLLENTLRITANALEHDFGIAKPRIAVTGLNPHAGEGGILGDEEAAIIAPAIQVLRNEGLRISGPHSADTLFHAEARQTYDAAVAMYHDQALIPLKTLAFDCGVNVTLGLPFVRTSPDHGTAFGIAGTGRARPGSFIAALQLAGELGLRRASVNAAAQR
jgi:4-hydroxythreonine-4-phosphate dehydrogenase